jgi:hypothetical protein
MDEFQSKEDLNVEKMLSKADKSDGDIYPQVMAVPFVALPVFLYAVAATIGAVELGVAVHQGLVKYYVMYTNN